MTKPTDSPRIIELRIRNVKRIRAVHITPTGAVVQITGKNGQGKTSVLDAMMYALGGEKSIPAGALRKGAISGDVTIDLSTHTVKRQFSDDGKSKLTITPKNGQPINSPQAWLNTLMGDIAFDPLAFSRQDPKEQAAVLRRVLGLDEKFKAIDLQVETLTAERRNVNANMRTAEAKLAGMPIVEAPEKEEDMGALAEQHAAAMQERTDNEEKRRWLAGVKSSREQWAAKVTQLEAALEAARKELAAREAGIAEQGEAIDALQDPDLTTISERMRTVQETNRKVAQKKERNRLMYESLGLKDKSEAQTQELDRLAESKAALVASATMPVPGMAFTADGVTLGGIAIAECSGAERLRASVAVGLAQNPKLRLMLIRDGSLLDSKSMEALEQIAKERDAQVWLERVDESGEVGVVIEDGAVLGTEIE